MKKVLIIAYAFPPRMSIGAQRPYKLAKYLPQYGWEPVILTARLPGKAPQDINKIRIVETGYTDVLGVIKRYFRHDSKKSLQEKIEVAEPNHESFTRKLIHPVKTMIAFPDENIGWYKHALHAANRFLSSERVHAIISTSYPVTSHLIANRLKRRFNIPWVADMRDLWTQNHFYNKSRALALIERILELKTLSRADILVTVTGEFARDLKLLHKKKKVFCVTNGYDSDDFRGPDNKLTEKFSITYTGMLYEGKRDPSLLFEAVSNLIKKGAVKSELMDLRFYGPRDVHLLNSIKKYRLEGVVSYFGVTSREESLKRQRESQLLLLLTDNDGRESGVYPAKIFEYFASGRPIIAFGGKEGAVKDLLETTRSGTFALNSAELERILFDYYRKFIAEGRISVEHELKIEKFNYKSIAGAYAEILDAITKNELNDRSTLKMFKDAEVGS